MNTLAFLEGLLRDGRHAFRMIRMNPGFSATAILSLALGIGTNTAIFNVVNAVLLRPLPYPEPESLVDLLFPRDVFRPIFNSPTRRKDDAS